MTTKYTRELLQRLICSSREGSFHCSVGALVRIADGWESEVKSAQGIQWQPIETLPPDNYSDVLLFSKCLCFVVGRRSSAAPKVVVVYSEAQTITNFTHWAPIHMPEEA